MAHAARGANLEATGFPGTSAEVLQDTCGHRHPDFSAATWAKKAGTFRWLTREGPTIRRKNLMISGRSGRIRTCDPCVPNAVLYRAEPHSDKKAAYSVGFDALQAANSRNLVR